MKRISFLIIAFGSCLTSSLAQDSTIFKLDFRSGGYLFLDPMPYKSVLMQGVALSYEHHNGFSYQIEYHMGSQEDDFGQEGITHQVGGSISYFLKPIQTRFRPYVLIGAGAMEFKDFTMDDYGLVFFGGAGLELKLHEKIKGLVEPRYLNVSNFNLDANNQFGIFWGLRAIF